MYANFPKKWHWNVIFLVFSVNIIFLFPKNIILFLRRKRKDDLSQKKKKKIMRICFLQMFWKDGFSKIISLEICFFFVISGKMVILFQRKHDIFFRRKMKDALSQKIHGNMTIFVYMCKYQIYDIILLPKNAIGRR